MQFVRKSKPPNDPSSDQSNISLTRHHNDNCTNAHKWRAADFRSRRGFYFPILINPPITKFIAITDPRRLNLEDPLVHSTPQDPQLSTCGHHERTPRERDLHHFTFWGTGIAEQCAPGMKYHCVLSEGDYTCDDDRMRFNRHVQSPRSRRRWRVANPAEWFMILS